MTVSLNTPINSVSFGQVSYNILKNFNSDFNFFPIGNVDFSSFKEDVDFGKKISNSVFNSFTTSKRTDPSFKLWHISGLLEGVGNIRSAMTFHETNELTKTEVNILNQLDLVFVTSPYTKRVFSNQITTEVRYVPLGFDSTHFYELPSVNDEAIIFGLFGKGEKRKATYRILNLWAKKFGNDKRYKLNLSINNSFLSGEIQNQLIFQALEGKQYWNINFIPPTAKNEDYNKVLNSIDIDLTGMSLCEGWNLPAFQTLCLGKQGVVLNAHGHKAFSNSENSILVEPKGATEANDGVFFKRGGKFNQGEWFNFDDEEFINAMEKATEKAKTYNAAGAKLKEFTYLKTSESILSGLKSL